jgi:bleomycin hydrolase
MKNQYKVLIFSAIVSMNSAFTQAQEIADSAYQFKTVYDLPVSSVKNQHVTGTCWNFATVSMLESELLRTGKGMFDLSEMFIVHHVYQDKAQSYILFDGKTEFSQGGEPNDVTDVLNKYGLMPQSAYNGWINGDSVLNHEEFAEILTNTVTTFNKEKNPSPNWKVAFNNIIDSYLGKLPETFIYNKKQYTAKSFAEFTGLKSTDYVLITSFTHHPFYQPFVLEIPDNWSKASSYNVPLDDLMKIACASLQAGYTFVWAADVSEKSFQWKPGLAFWPERPLKYTNGQNIENKNITSPLKEITANQQLRQEAFEQKYTTDDHSMHIVGLSTLPDGTQFFKVKNSWGTDNKYNGFLFASENYFKMKTLMIMVNKNAIPSEIRKKLNL